MAPTATFKQLFTNNGLKEKAPNKNIDENDVLALCEEMSAKKKIQPKIRPDYLQNLRIKFLDTRPLKQKSIAAITPAIEEPLDKTSNTKDTEPVPTPVAGSASEEEINLVAQPKNQALENVQINDFQDLMYANALAGRPDEAEQALQLMEKYQLKPNVQCYTHIMDAYANVRDLDNVVATFKRMQKNNLEPDIYSYSTLIKAFAQDLRLDDALVVFEKLKKSDIIPTQPVFSSLISGFIKANKIERAWDLFDEMRLSYHQADEVSFTMMLHACAKRGEVERALNLFEDMANYNLYPTDVTFNVLIHACAKRPDYFDEAFSMFHQMQDVYGFQPDRITYNTLITACARKRNLARARSIFKLMLEDTKTAGTASMLIPDRYTYTNLFWCYANYTPPSTKNKNVETTDVSAEDGALVETCVLLPNMPDKRSKVVEESKLIFNHLLNEGVPLTTSLLTSYMSVHIAQKQTREVVSIYDGLFTQHGIERDLFTYQRMLNFCYATKDIELSWKVWEDYQDFLENRRLAYQTQANDNSLLKQKKLEATRLEDELTSGWTEENQKDMVLLMANTLARSNELKHSIALLSNHFKTPADNKYKPRLAELQTVYVKCVQLEDEESKKELVDLCRKNNQRY
ncbi:hypothetical protein PHYBLDRAFT_150730 [Phycomyces blakesleeanus NRRL 1555(-)]|uniref:Pentacotripeptide-repeat region of PRORP domain-containing protein n=1 Tax=Phycomyces blakesleeanus (strain ATCC 8743b / DSM 1359 / FGSC 10004 / NBRC 33097 / NRRL 1555) TaxID=763407 RepID=A0A162N378_PHYB8|nr:hypothetical protein PHYBLDRAFT_150730 [Phycomyces blakesleeanus NRRL 1555(-)]OAD68058.1 hypothetical protein PHYBLDRAFT_150730 [Phycomyces blakesleeanus NRRL 1555(-)]|eukprot:XP_018286098.1 hypothetical protein PHYBLDRAFT_150730 [Phycomyces blakesleeanus NRRL 1555(-)]